MISTEMRLTWVQRVKPHLFGAHLERYIGLQPTFETLRLCARYGKGDAAFINRLPAELVEHVIEQLLAEDRMQLMDWFLPMHCFHGRCEPVDHAYSEDDLVKLYAHYIHGVKLRDAASKTGLNVDERMDLNDMMMEDGRHFDEILPGIDCWQELHGWMCSRWTDLMGDVAGTDSGKIQTFKGFFRQHFGLHLWVSHNTIDEKWYHEDFMSSTEVFIMLPTSACAYDQLPQRLAGEQITVKLPTEHTTSFCVVPPPPPSAKSMARFARCLKMLDLKALPLFGRQDLVDGRKARVPDSEDDDASSNASGSEYEAEEESRETGPALRLLVVTKDNSQSSSED